MANWTVKKLYQSTLRLSPRRQNTPTSPDIQLVNILPFAGVKSVLIQLTLRGVTQKTSGGYPVNHHVNLVFYNVDIRREPVKGYLKVTDNTGDYWFLPPNANEGVIRIRCTCHDFYFTWGIWDFKSGALFGDAPRPYRRKTTYYPERNPAHYEGICKHVINGVKFLQRKKIIT